MVNLRPTLFHSVITWAALIGFAWGAAPTQSLPPFDSVRGVVRSYFQHEKDFHPSDIVSRKQARAILDEIEQLGWKLADRNKFEKQVLDDRDFLVTQLRTAKGKAFMRKIAALPLAYDRLDRMAALPQGRSTVERLVAGPGGEKLIEYMAEAKGGYALGKMLSKDGAGDFNQPTGKLYTSEQLERELIKLYEQAAAARR